jgi:hypothetical protein
MIDILSLIQEYRMGITASTENLLSENLATMMEIVHPETTEVAGQEDEDIPVTRVAVELATDVFPESTMTVAECDILNTEIISEFTG